MKILQVCKYGANYPGNFIASLECLEKRLEMLGIETIYAFVEEARNTEWCKRICERTKVYFLPEAKARILPKTYSVFKQIYLENDIGIVHSHFELYDIPATIMAPKNVKIFWHLHDPITGGQGLRKILWKIQYGLVGKRAFLVSVSDFYRNKAVKLGFPEKQTEIVLNCIDLNRVKQVENKRQIEYQFLTFGWDFYRKGDDLIINVCNKLWAEGYRFKLLLNGVDTTWPILDEYIGADEPEWLVRGMPTSDVNYLFSKAGVFVQASRKETFSYAVCEASYAGLPVICSDIAGLEWAHILHTVSFFENENEQNLYNIMKMSLINTQDIHTNVMETRANIEQLFSLDSWVDRILNCYGIRNK